MKSAAIINRPLPVVFLTLLVDMLGYGILIPVIPLLLADPTSPYFLLPPGYSLNQGYILLGFLLGTYPLMQFFATPVLGKLSDKYGRRIVLTISLLGTCFSYLVFAYAILSRNIPLLFLARALDGITGGNISVAQAAVADITPPEKRARNFALIGAAFGIGLILGPFLGGFFSDPSVMAGFNAATPFWVAGMISFVNVLSVLLFFPETLSVRKKDTEISWLQSVKNIVKAYNAPRLRVIYLTAFLFQGGFSFFITFLGVYLIRKFGFDQSSIGHFFSFVGIWLVLAQVFITRHIANRFAEHRVLRVSLLCVSVLTFMFFLPDHWLGLFLIAPLHAVFIALSQANIPGLISRTSEPTVQGEVLGISSSVQTLAQALPPILSGYLAAAINPSSPLLVSSVVILAGSFVYVFGYYHKSPLARN